MPTRKDVSRDMLVHVKEGWRTDISNSAMFHTNPVVDFRFPSMYVIFRKEGVPTLQCLSRAVTGRQALLDVCNREGGALLRCLSAKWIQISIL